MTDFYEGPTREIEKFLYAPFDVSPITFFIGLVVIDTVLIVGLYWNESFEECKDDTKLCNKSLQVFQNITYSVLWVFGALFFVHFVAYGVRKHNLKPIAFLPVVSFTVFINLFVWLFRDVFTVMIDDYFETEDDLTVILRKQFYAITTNINFSDSDNELLFLLPALTVLGVLMGKSFKN